MIFELMICLSLFARLWTFFGSIFFAFAMISLIALADSDPITFDGVVPKGSDMPASQVDQAYEVEKTH